METRASWENDSRRKNVAERIIADEITLVKRHREAS